MSETYEVETEDFDYLSHDGKPLRARLYLPKGKGPFPAFVDGHGGAWIQGGFAGNDGINRPLATGGMVILAADYRLPPAGTYPASVADFNYGIRWLKKNAERCRTRPELVGAMGTSAGGHLAVLAAITPRDPRYAAVPLPGGEKFDASVNCVISMWPVICPYTRFRENVERHQVGDRAYEHRVGSGLDQMKYWLTEDAMADGSPMLAAEKGEAIDKPPMLYIQTTGDNLHPRHCMDRFCAAYEKLGGHVEKMMLEGEPYDLVRVKPDSGEAMRAKRRILEFVHEQKSAALANASARR